MNIKMENKKNNNEKRNLWTRSETDILLSIMKRKNIDGVLKSRKYDTNMVYKLVETEMMKMGCYQKNANQIQFKWKNLKTQYVRHTNISMETGDPVDRNIFPHYDILVQIFSNSKKIAEQNGEANNDTVDGDSSTASHPAEASMSQNSFTKANNQNPFADIKVNVKQLHQLQQQQQQQQQHDQDQDQDFEPEEAIDLPTVSANEKRNLWSFNEVIAMLKIFHEQNILSTLMSKKRYRKIEAYQEVEVYMNEQGFCRKSAKQILMKWNQLKIDYFKFKQYGIINSSTSFLRSVEVQELLSALCENKPYVSLPHSTSMEYADTNDGMGDDNDDDYDDDDWDDSYENHIPHVQIHQDPDDQPEIFVKKEFNADGDDDDPQSNHYQSGNSC